MSNVNDKREEEPIRKPLNLDRDHPSEAGTPNTFDEMSKASQKGSLFHRLGASFSDMLQTSRGPERGPQPFEGAPEAAQATADDLAIRRAKTVGPKRMIVPEGVIIGGPMSSGAETEICGRVDGDVTVDGRLFLGNTALISGSVRAASCRIEGLVEGKMECSQDLELGQTGRLNADVVAGKRITVAGQIRGNVSTGGVLRLVSTGRIEGNIHTRQLVIEEGAMFNGVCTMRTPAQRSDK
jgi:cytoskeletal protein CcmA (bactofilin family)